MHPDLITPHILAIGERVGPQTSSYCDNEANYSCHFPESNSVSPNRSFVTVLTELP